MKLLFLGTGAAGWPLQRPDGCEEFRRMSAALIDGTLLIDPGPQVPDALAETMAEIDAANRLAAKAAEGDSSALREYVETDPALGGLDRIYCMDVVDALLRLHSDMLGG